MNSLAKTLFRTLRTPIIHPRIYYKYSYTRPICYRFSTDNHQKKPEAEAPIQKQSQTPPPPKSDNQTPPPSSPNVFSKLGQAVVTAWKITFPNQQDEVKRKLQERKKKAAETPKYTAEELEQLQNSIPEHRRTSLTTTDIPTQTEKKGFVQKLIPEKLKSKLKDTEMYKKYDEASKEYAAFKQDFKEYASTREGVVFQAANLAYGTVAGGSPIARAVETMKVIDPSFDVHELEAEATHIFVSNYQNFLKGEISKVELQSGDQALQYFKAHTNMYRNKKVKPKFTSFWDHNTCTLHNAKVEEKSTAPIFYFRIEAQEIYCFVDINDKIADGDEERLIRSTFEFGLKYGGNAMQEYGHNWEIVEIKKIEEMRMLV